MHDFSSSHVRMWELDNKNGWAPKNWCLQTVVLEKTLESHLDSKEIKPVNPEGNQWKDWWWSWSSSTLATWCEEPTQEKSLMLEKNWMQEEKGTTEDEMVRWHHRLDEFEQTPDGEGQGSLACCSPWSHKDWVRHDWATEQQQLENSK